jgi:transposase
MTLREYLATLDYAQTCKLAKRLGVHVKTVQRWGRITDPANMRIPRDEKMLRKINQTTGKRVTLAELRDAAAGE